jgi:hypothetical protein
MFHAPWPLHRRCIAAASCPVVPDLLPPLTLPGRVGGSGLGAGQLTAAITRLQAFAPG